MLPFERELGGVKSVNTMKATTKGSKATPFQRNLCKIFRKKKQ